MPEPPVPSPQSPPLAIVGASARSAAASAARAGFRPIAADLFADADLRRMATATRISPYPEGLLDWFRTVQPPAWMYTGALENHPELVDQMAWISPLWGNSGDVLARVRSPQELAAALRAAGLLFPETRASADGLPDNGSWLTKTYRGASGSGVRAWRGEQGAGSGEREISTPVSDLPAPCWYQRRIAGDPLAVVFVAAGGAATLLGVTRQLVGEGWLGAHGYQYAGSIGPLPMAQATLAEIAQIGSVLAQEFELVGLFGVDLIFDGDRLWTLEVNPRYTASVEIVERAAGVQAVAAHAKACAGGLEAGDWRLAKPTTSPQSQAPSPHLHGKAILYARRNTVISDQFAASTLAEGLSTPWPTLADISSAGTMIECGRPVLTIFSAGTTADEVEQRLRERVADLERGLYAG